MAPYSLGGLGNAAAASATVGMVISCHGWAARSDVPVNTASIATSGYRGEKRVFIGEWFADW